MSELNKLLDKKTNDNALHKVPGIVVSYDNSTGYAVVSLQTLNNVEHKFINKSGEYLSVGDEVQIWYFTKIYAGFIGLRCGKSNIFDKISNLEARIKALEEA